jgi:hypothetical protein
LPSKAIDNGAGPVDQSPTAQFLQSTHKSVGTSRRDNSSTTTGDHGLLTTPALASEATIGSAD